MLKAFKESKQIAIELNTSSEIISYIASCYSRLKLNRLQMSERQKNKISHYEIKVLPELKRAIEKRKNNPKKYPNTEENREKIIKLENNFHSTQNTVNERHMLFIFLNSISDENFKRIIKIKSDKK